MNNKIYETFLQRMKETNEVKELQSSNVRIIQSALLPILPISPNVLTQLQLMFLFNVIFGIIYFVNLF